MCYTYDKSSTYYIFNSASQYMTIVTLCIRTIHYVGFIAFTMRKIGRDHFTAFLII